MTTYPARRLALPALALLSAFALPAGAAARDGIEADEDGLTVSTGDVEFNLGGRIHLDASVFEHGLDEGSEVDFRRARLQFSARVGDVVRVRVDREFAQADGWRNVWIALRPVEGVELKGGNQIVPFSMEDMASSNSLTLAERSLANTFAPAFGLGGSVRYSHDNFTLAAGYFTDALADEVGQSRVRGDGFAVRATFAPVRKRKTWVHLGAAYESRSFDPAEPPRFTVVSASSLAPRLLRTGGIDGASDLQAYNAEFAAARGPVSVQAQYIATRIERTGLDPLDFSGWYGQASWMVTGERYRYSRRSGMPTGARIGRKGGAIELAARYSEADLDDPGLDRGRASVLTLGATWYLDRNVRVLANYARTETSDSLLTPDASGDLGVVRFQIAF
ncbi:porin [Erythrobacter sp.]|uniref:OprO/OprP family phosphate-selective porin n=1 Tax=Erythrobacter sp. TaxID=1042 RepID=UPI001425CEBC|nr:porin [Erythrobacter sp.]QIQ85458.1 MAG: porin [Erythrobacter sp.]